jgi:hypothetical protein
VKLLSCQFSLLFAIVRLCEAIQDSSWIATSSKTPPRGDGEESDWTAASTHRNEFPRGDGRNWTATLHTYPIGVADRGDGESFGWTASQSLAETEEDVIAISHFFEKKSEGEAIQKFREIRIYFYKNRHLYEDRKFLSFLF